MKYLLDTAVFILSLNEPERLNNNAQHLLAKGSQEIYLSSVSSWEIAIKWSLGKLRLPDPPAYYVPGRIALLGLKPLHITHPHALAVSDLTPYHQDPFDWLLIAQARSENMVLMTTDHVFSKYPVQTLWCGR